MNFKRNGLMAFYPSSALAARPVSVTSPEVLGAIEAMRPRATANVAVGRRDRAAFTPGFVSVSFRATARRL